MYVVEGRYRAGLFFSGLSEPPHVGDYKKPESRARTANISIESLLHCAIYGETMAEMVVVSSRYDPPPRSAPWVRGTREPPLTPTSTTLIQGADTD